MKGKGKITKMDEKLGGVKKNDRIEKSEVTL